MSEFLAGKSVRKIVEGIEVERAAALPPQTATENLFTVAGGRVLLKQILGEVTTEIGNVANNTNLSFNPTDAAAGNMCAVADIDSDAVGTVYGITGTVATALQKSTNVLLGQVTPHILKPGTIDLICAASSVTGAIKWTVIYVPIDDGAYIEVA
jgi:hypothetical protein